jgi:hypothetical protein
MRRACRSQRSNLIFIWDFRNCHPKQQKQHVVLFVSPKHPATPKLVKWTRQGRVLRLLRHHSSETHVRTLAKFWDSRLDIVQKTQERTSKPQYHVHTQRKVQSVPVEAQSDPMLCGAEQIVAGAPAVCIEAGHGRQPPEALVRLPTPVMCQSSFNFGTFDVQPYTF